MNKVNPFAPLLFTHSWLHDEASWQGMPLENSRMSRLRHIHQTDDGPHLAAGRGPQLLLPYARCTQPPLAMHLSCEVLSGQLACVLQACTAPSTSEERHLESSTGQGTQTHTSTAEVACHSLSKACEDATITTQAVQSNDTSPPSRLPQRFPCRAAAPSRLPPLGLMEPEKEFLRAQ